MKHFRRFLDYFDQHEYLSLIASLILLLVFYPFALEWSNATLWIHGCLSLVLITGMYAASTFKKFLHVSIIFGSMSLIFLWVEYMFASKLVLLLYIITGLILFCFIIINLVRNLEKEDTVTLELILGAIAGYLVIGVLSAFIFALIQFFEPHAISGITVQGLEAFPQLMYYSFVNLTTVGFGDIIPVTPHAQAWSVISVISAQMYLTILIAVIVGKYIKRHRE